MLGLIVVLAWPAFKPTDDKADRVPIDQFQEQGGTAPTGGGAPGPLTGTPREQADRLFNRVMSERENGDTARAKFFLPMAIQAFEMAGDLDADGLYHLSLLQSFGGDDKAARITAERILANDASHLLGLAAAADAARAAGDNAAARKHYQKFLSVYDAEMKKQKIEYQDHKSSLRIDPTYPTHPTYLTYLKSRRQIYKFPGQSELLFQMLRQCAHAKGFCRVMPRVVHVDVVFHRVEISVMRALSGDERIQLSVDGLADHAGGGSSNDADA
jgi:hypothetical protein